MRNIDTLVNELFRYLDPVSVYFLSHGCKIYAVEPVLYDTSGYGSVVIHYIRDNDRFINNITVFPENYVLATTSRHALGRIKRYGLRGKTAGKNLLEIFYTMDGISAKLKQNHITR